MRRLRANFILRKEIDIKHSVGNEGQTPLYFILSNLKFQREKNLKQKKRKDHHSISHLFSSRLELFKLEIDYLHGDEIWGIFHITAISMRVLP